MYYANAKIWLVDLLFTFFDVDIICACRALYIDMSYFTRVGIHVARDRSWRNLANKGSALYGKRPLDVNA